MTHRFLRSLPTRLAWCLATVSLVVGAGLPASGHAHDRGAHALPRLTAAAPGALLGPCDALAERLAGLPRTTITGQSRSPQRARNCSTATVAITGFDSGSTMLQ